LYQQGDIVVPVLKNVSFGLERGEFVFLTGPSGSGKTTLIKLLIRQEVPTKGSILFETVPIELLPRQLIPSYRRTVGVVFQDYKLLEHKTVYENVAFVLEILNKALPEVQKTVEYLLDYVGLVDKRICSPSSFLVVKNAVQLLLEQSQITQNFSLQTNRQAILTRATPTIS
jgi:ABC-type ATPase involved in cell division